MSKYKQTMGQEKGGIEDGQSCSKTGNTIAGQKQQVLVRMRATKNGEVHAYFRGRGGDVFPELSGHLSVLFYCILYFVYGVTVCGYVLCVRVV